MAAAKIEPFTDPKTIVVATDFSPTADLAFERACELAGKHGSQVVLVHAVAAQAIPYAGPMPVLPPPDIREHLRAESSEKLEALAQRVRDVGCEASIKLLTGLPGPHIVEVARAVRADLIVLGTRGLSGFKHAVLGSTAERVVRRSECPVLTIHPESKGSLSEVRTVIVPTQLYEDPTPIAHEVVRLLGREAAAIKLVLAYSDYLPAYLKPLIRNLGVDRIEFEELERDLRARLAPIAAELSDAGFSVETLVTEGDPVTIITELASDRAADLIAMHTHGRTGLQQLLLRSVAERVVQHAGCPVITVRLSDAPGPLSGVETSGGSAGHDETIEEREEVMQLGLTEEERQLLAQIVEQSLSESKAALHGKSAGKVRGSRARREAQLARLAERIGDAEA